MKIGCVIMASGLGKRFGGNKLLADFHGQTLIERILELTKGALFAKRVIVTRSEAVASIGEQQGVKTILHHFPNRNDTVRLGIEAMQDMDGCIFCPCDQPLLERETLEQMCSAFQDKRMILRLVSDKQCGTPILFGSDYFAELCCLPEKAGGSYVVKKYIHAVKEVAVKHEEELWDVDTVADLKRLLEVPREHKIYALTEEGRLMEQAIETMFSFSKEERNVVSLVGAGGKTTVMYTLAWLYAKKGYRVLVTTTTHIQKPEEDIYAETWKEVERLWEQQKPAFVGQASTQSGKLQMPAKEVLDSYLKMADLVLIEADGAKRKPCKAPRAHEPVILPECDTVIGVMGCDVIGQTIEAGCFCVEEVLKVLQLSDANHIVTAENLVELICSEQGTRKGVEDRRFHMVVNKWDREYNWEQGEAFLRALYKKGIKNGCLWRLEKKNG